MDLDGKVAIVTGGAVRIGKAIVTRLSQRGVKVCLHYGKSAVQAQETVDGIQSSGGTVSLVQADLTEPVRAAAVIVEHAVSQFGHVDILVNNAAVFEEGSFSDTAEDAWDRQLDINLKAPFFLCQTFAAQRQMRRRAHIVNLADWRALRPGADHVAYTLTKAALVSLTQCLAQQLAPDVQVNAIAPGAILPPGDKGAEYLDNLARQIPLRRTGSPDDVCDALVFLLQSDFITGEIIRLTGGEDLVGKASP